MEIGFFQFCRRPCKWCLIRRAHASVRPPDHGKLIVLEQPSIRLSFRYGIESVKLNDLVTLLTVSICQPVNMSTLSTCQPSEPADLSTLAACRPGQPCRHFNHDVLSTQSTCQSCQSCQPVDQVNLSTLLTCRHVNHVHHVDLSSPSTYEPVAPVKLLTLYGIRTRIRISDWK